jgi:rhamnosyltransferase
LYITTNSHEKKLYIEKCVKDGFNDKQPAKIVVTENIGRDVLPWLSLSEHLKNYDIVGHFHTKKSDHADFWIGEIWQEDMFEMLLTPANKIMEIFYNNPDIGMVIPDMASCFHIQPHIFLHENTNKRIINKLWEKMKCTKTVRFKDLTVFIMPYGNMFWYRPVALKPLFDLGLSAGDFPREPLPVDSTITHAIERITLYVSWNSGYDFRIIKNEKPLCNSFIDNMSYISTYNSFVLKSKTYLIAKILFFLPRMTRKAIAELTNIIKGHYNYSKKYSLRRAERELGR